jgi:hypothetical protein
MDDLVDNAREAAERRAEVVRSAQKRSSNVYLLRHLKWGGPKPAGADRKSMSLLDVLLGMAVLTSIVLLIVTAVSLHGSVNSASPHSQTPSSHRLVVFP